MDNPLSNRTTKAQRTTKPSWKQANPHTIFNTTPLPFQRRTTATKKRPIKAIPTTTTVKQHPIITTSKRPAPTIALKTETLVEEITDIGTTESSNVPTTMKGQNIDSSIHTESIMSTIESVSTDENIATTTTIIENNDASIQAATVISTINSDVDITTVDTINGINSTEYSVTFISTIDPETDNTNIISINDRNTSQQSNNSNRITLETSTSVITIDPVASTEKINLEIIVDQMVKTESNESI